MGNDNALSGHLQITKTELTSARSISSDPTVAETGCTSAFCNYNGNCIDDSTDGQHPSPYCICSDGYSGDDCSIEAFSASTTIATSSNFLGTVATGNQYGSMRSGGGAACTDMSSISHHGCLRITNSFSGAWTLKNGIGHQQTADYYADWNIVISGDGVFGQGVITSSSAADPPVLTDVAWETDATPDTPSTWTDVSYTIWTNVERGQMSAPLTLQTGNLHSTAVDYYKGWAIATTASPSGGSGTITGNSATGLLTVQWTSLSGTTSSSTTYTLTPPTQCNTQNEWQANGDENSEKNFASANTLDSSASTEDDYYNGMSLTVTSGAGKSEEDGTVSAVSVSNGVQQIALEASNGHWTADADYYTGFYVTLCSGACASTDVVGTGIVATSTTADPPVITVTWSSTEPTADTSSGYVLTHPGYTITDYIGSTRTVTTAPPLPTTAADGGSFPTTAYVINTCSTGHSWNDASKVCTRYSGAYEHVWEPFIYIGEGNLQHCAPIENLVAADNNVENCRNLCSPKSESGTMASATQLQSSNDHSTQINFYVGWTIVTGTPVGTGNPITFGTGDSASRGVERGTITQSLADLSITVDWDDGATPTLSAQTTCTLTPPPSACNAFTHDSSSPECKLYTCPTAVAPVTTAAETMAGSWGVDETASKRAHHRAPLTCCAADDDWTVATKCTNPVPGYYDEESCTSVKGVTTAAACEQVVAGDKETCENSPATTVEDTCELKPYEEVPDSLCSPEAIRNGYDGSTTAKSCDAFDVVKLNCATQKCTPSAAGANPYKIGYVSCTGSDCTINAAKPIVEVPFVVAGLPAHSKVLTYVDSQPYPATGANSVRYMYNCEASDAACVAQGIHSKPTCTETASVSVAATRALCEAVSGGTQAACEAIAGCTFTAGTATSAPFVESSVKIYDMAPLPTGKKHTLVMMLLTDDGEPLGTVLKQFEVGYAGVCTVAPDGSVCGGNGACHLGYCVCQDGYFGTTCERNVDEDGSDCAAQSSSSESECEAADGDGATPGFGNYQCNWDSTTELCSIQVVTTGFTAGGVYEARAMSMTASKLGEARFLNTRMLEANSAAIKQSDDAGVAETAGTKTKLETVTASVVATVAAAKSATQTNVDALYSKTERNAIKVRQAKEESLRLQTSNLEAKLEMQRSLAAHQTEVQNRFQSKRFDVYKLNALKQDKLKQEFARTRFTLNQLLTSNGPTVDPSQFTESTCTTDQFYNVECTETVTDKSAYYTGTGYVSDQTTPEYTGSGTLASPVIAIEGQDIVGEYSDVNRGR